MSLPWRTDEVAVMGILLDNYGKTRDQVLPSLNPFIATANVIVDELVECAADDGVAFTAARLELIERWLAAHAYAMSDQVPAAKTTDRAKDVYGGKTGMHLEATKFGQMAIALDSTGCLMSLTSGVKQGRLDWGGKPPSEQIDYLDRD